MRVQNHRKDELNKIYLFKMYTPGEGGRLVKKDDVIVNQAVGTG